MPVIIYSIAVAWALYDVHKSGAPTFWFYIVLFVPGGGLLLYVFLEKLPGLSLPKRLVKKLLNPPKSTAQLKFELESCPSRENKIAYSNSLLSDGNYQEALKLIEELLKKEPDAADIQLSHAKALYGVENYSECLKIVEEIASKDYSFNDYEAPLLEINLHKKMGTKSERVLELAQKLTKKDSRLKHQILLANIHKDQGTPEEAKKILTEALADYKASPSFYRRANRWNYISAKRLLGSL